jgi:hypothetical protein
VQLLTTPARFLNKQKTFFTYLVGGGNQLGRSFALFFFLDKKETKNQDFIKKAKNE